MLKHANRPSFQLVKTHSRKYVGVQRADNFRVQTSQQRNAREFRGDDCSATATLLKRLGMIALELFKEHSLARAANSVDKHAGHSNGSRSGKQLLEATKASIANGIANPPVSSKGYPLRRGRRECLLLAVDVRRRFYHHSSPE